jgi:hypothetical protein
MNSERIVIKMTSVELVIEHARVSDPGFADIHTAPVANSRSAFAPSNRRGAVLCGPAKVQLRMKVRRSALITSACTVIRPWG